MSWTVPSAPVAAGWANEWEFWALVTVILLAAFALNSRYRVLTARARRQAVSRGLVALPSGQALDRAPRSFSADLSWLALLAGVWVMLAPWIWGYHDADGAITTDVVTGALVVALTLAAIVLPGLWTLNVLAGLWLVVAPWIVGYGDANGPVGLSDTIAGIVICAVSIASLVTSERAVRPGQGNAIGRIRR
jgi:hypothetical protein